MAFTQQKANRRFALIVVAFLIPSMQTLSHDPRPSLTFGIGFLALLAGIGLQYNKFGDLVGELAQQVLCLLHVAVTQSVGDLVQPGADKPAHAVRGGLVIDARVSGGVTRQPTWLPRPATRGGAWARDSRAPGEE